MPLIVGLSVKLAVSKTYSPDISELTLDINDKYLPNKLSHNARKFEYAKYVINTSKLCIPFDIVYVIGIIANYLYMNWNELSIEVSTSISTFITKILLAILILAVAFFAFWGLMALSCLICKAPVSIKTNTNFVAACCGYSLELERIERCRYTSSEFDIAKYRKHMGISPEKRAYPNNPIRNTIPNQTNFNNSSVTTTPYVSIEEKIAAEIEKLKPRFDEFNKKYHCNISADEFIDNVNKEMRAENFDAWDDAYKSVFSRAYKKTMLHMISNRDATIVDADQMLTDFDRIIDRLDYSCKISNITTNANPYARMDKAQRCGFLINQLQDLPYTYSGVVENQYNEGKIRIRDIVGNARKAIYGENIKNDIEGQKRIIGSIRALERVSGGRKGVWSFIYHFRGKAELREANSMRQMLKEAIGDAAFDNAESTSKGMVDSLQRVKNDLQEMMDIELANDGYGVNRTRYNDDDLEYDSDEYFYSRFNQSVRTHMTFESNELDDELNYDDREIEDDEPAESVFGSKESNPERLERFKSESAPSLNFK